MGLRVVVPGFPFGRQGLEGGLRGPPVLLVSCMLIGVLLVWVCHFEKVH